MNPAPQFTALPPQRRLLAFEQAAAQRAIHPVILEKDLWVCWLLGVLFSLPDIGPHLVFKGGTSLSKVFGVIDRFSEDVDLSVSPAFVGADADAFEALGSRTRRDAAMAQMQRLCAAKVQTAIEPSLETAIRETLGEPRDGDTWLRYELDEHGQGPVLYFLYPAAQDSDLPYIRRQVKLEFGSLTDQQPVGRHAVRPWIAEAFPALFTDWRCDVIALELARSFWEKATILHAEYHRPASTPMPDRYARHYADFVRLLEHPHAASFIADRSLCERVVRWKSAVFARSWASYDSACHGSFRLLPPATRHAALEEDYALMRQMFLTEPLSFAELMEKLAIAERTIND